MREDLQLTNIIFKCPNTKQEISLNEEEFELIGNSWDREDSVGYSTRLDIPYCPSCYKSHNEVVSSSEYNKKPSCDNCGGLHKTHLCNEGTY